MNGSQLIVAIQQCARKTGLAPATITRMAVGNSRLYSRLLAGGDCTTGTASRLIEFMAGIQRARADRVDLAERETAP